MATTKIQSGAFPTDVVNTAAIDDLAVTHAKLHTTMDLSSKTVTLPALSQTIVNSSHIQIGGNLDVVGQIGAYDNPGSSWGTMILRATDFEFKNAGGTIKMVLNTSGNVGIGTSSNIDSNLHVVDGTAQINIEGTSGDATLKLESTGNSYWNIFNDQSDARKLKFEDNGNGVALTIQRDGNVGIGNTSPESKLNIGTPDKGVGNLGMLHTQGVIETQGGSPTSMTTTDGNNGILWRHDGWGVDNTSTGNRFLAYLANSDASLIFANNSFSPTLTIAQNGNVGIGTTSPDTILEIVSSNPILTLRDTSTGFNNGDATLRLAESGTGDVLGSYFDVRLDASMLKFDFTPEGGSSSTYMSINSSDGQTNFESIIQVGNSATTPANAGAGAIKYDGTLYFSDGNDWKAVSVSINDGSSVSKAFDDLSEVAGIYSSDIILYTTVQGYETSTLQYTVDFTDAANPKYQATNSNSGVYDTNGTFGGCSQGTGTGWTVWDAARYCMRGGARLCSRAELDSNTVVGGTGCSHDNRAIWTYTTNASGNFYRGAGINSNSTNEGYVAGTNTSPSGYSTNEIGIRCCGTGASGGALWEI